MHDPFFSAARSAVEELMLRSGFHVASEAHHPRAFGSAYVEYRDARERIRLTWDGRDRWLELSVVPLQSTARPLRLAAWNAAAPVLPAAPGADPCSTGAWQAQLAQLQASIRAHLGLER